MDASMDIQQATHLAKAMVMHWGMSDTLGNVLYGEAQEYVFLGRDMMRSKDYSEETAKQIDYEVKRIVDGCFKTAKELIATHRDKLEKIANGLLEYETLDGTQVAEIVNTGTFTPPPKPPVDTTPMMGAPAGTPLPETPPKPAPPILPGGLGTPAPAPAG